MIEVRFTEGPPRRYDIRDDDGPWLTVPSVSTIAGNTAKPALVGWAQRQTLTNVCRLAARGPIPTDANQLYGALRSRDLLIDKDRDQAAQRGTQLHADLEAWGDRQQLPDPRAYADADRGYVRALAGWLAKDQPEFLETEEMVGSTRHGFAGRLDNVLRVRTHKGTGLFDLKSSKRVYPDTHFIQAEGYELGRVEMGREPTDFRCIVVIRADGTFDSYESTAQAGDFLNALHDFISRRDVTRKHEAKNPKPKRRAKRA